MIKYAENLVIDMLKRLVNVHLSEYNQDSDEVDPPVMNMYPDEVCYRVLVYVLHKHGLLSNISNVSPTLIAISAIALK